MTWLMSTICILPFAPRLSRFTRCRPREGGDPWCHIPPGAEYGDGGSSVTRICPPLVGEGSSVVHRRRRGEGSLRASARDAGLSAAVTPAGRAGPCKRDIR